jgi:hypothetical protein
MEGAYDRVSVLGHKLSHVDVWGKLRCGSDESQALAPAGALLSASISGPEDERPVGPRAAFVRADKEKYPRLFWEIEIWLVDNSLH